MEQSQASPSASGLMIEDDIPGTWLRLAWNGAAPNGYVRWATTTFMAIVVGVWINVLLIAVDMFRAPGPRRGDAELLAVTLGMSFFMLLGGASIAGRIAGYWHEFLWDGVEKTFHARRHGWFLWGRQTVTIPFGKMRWVSLDIGPEQGGAPVDLKLQVMSDDVLPFTADLTSLGISSRDEAQELLFTIARLIGVDGFRIHANTARELSVQAWRSRVEYEGPADPTDADDEAVSDLRPIPARGTAWSVPAPRKPAPVDSVRCAHQVDLPKVMSSLTITRIEDWKPGTLVRIVRPSAPWFVYAIVVGLVALPSAAFGYWFVFGFIQNIFGLDDASRWVVMAFVAGSAGCFVGFLLNNNLKERELVMDWRRQRMSMRYGEATREWPLSAVQQLILSEKRHEVPQSLDDDKSPPVIDGYGSRLDLVLPHDDLIVIETERWEPDAAAADRILAPLGTELASSLKIKYARGRAPTSDAKDVADALRLTKSQAGILTVIGLIAASLLASAAIRTQGVRQAVWRLRELGVTAERMGSFSHNRSVVCRDFVRLQLSDNKPLVAHGDEIARLLSGLPRVGLDLHESSLTDDDLKLFRGVKVCLANIEKSKIGDSGLESLANSRDLVYLNADESQITDASVPVIESLPHLRFLFFRRTSVTRAGIDRIHRLGSLERVEP